MELLLYICSEKLTIKPIKLFNHMKHKLSTKLLKLTVLILPFTFLFFLNSCLEGVGGGGLPQQEPVSKEVSNDQGGSVSQSDYSILMLPNSLMQTNPNQIPSVTLSIEVGAETPVNIPSTYQLIGQVVKFGSEGFVFNYPLQLIFPVGDATDCENFVVIYFDELEEDWVEIQITDILSEPNRVAISSFKLGTFALARKSNLRSNQPHRAYGGVRIGRNVDWNVFYSLTIKDFIPKYQVTPNQAARFIGYNATSLWEAETFHTRNPLAMVIPQGEYHIWVSKLEINSGRWFTYSVPCHIVVDRPLNRVWLTWSLNMVELYREWYDLSDCLTGGTWIEYRPDELPIPSETVGTGKFQATLTWTNSANSTADLDLHMYGPNNVHIYWDNKSEPDFAFELDYDWIDEPGNAVENIYSVSDDITPGRYKIAVHNYYGVSQKRYNVRIINNGVVKNFSGTIDDDEEKILYEFNY